MTNSDSVKKVQVGSGITSYRREETLLDDEYRDDFVAGKPVPAGLRRNSTRPFVDLRRDIEVLCEEIFAKNNLPDPFALLPINEELEMLNWHQLKNRGASQIKSTLDQGYMLCAVLHCPKEDHSPLWYAARMSATLAELDVVQAQGTDRWITPAELASLSAHLGCEFGRLETEFRFKENNEDRALSGQSVADGGARGGRSTATNRKPQTQKILNAMAARVGKMSIRNAARLTFERDGLGKSAEANRKLWGRHKRQ